MILDINSALLCGKDDPKTPRPWNLYQEIIRSSIQVTINFYCIVGCGTAIKIIPLANHFKESHGP